MHEKPDVGRVPYGLAVHDHEEEKAVLEVLQNHKTIMGDKVKEFENKIAVLFGKKFGIMVNSGSSANLLAFELINLPKDSEIITPILTFSTTLAPILQKKLIPVFVDVEPDTYLINLDNIENLINKNTKALMIPSLLGNIPNLKQIRKLADKHNLIFIEDSCDTLGATFDNTPTGIYSDISTTSFYGSHIITAAGEGGMICLNNSDMEKRARILRGWGRTSAINESENIDERYSSNLDDIPYDSKFIFEEIGYNFLPSEISAAFGLVQLNKLNQFKKIRNENFNQLKEFFSNFDYFVLPKQLPFIKTSWLAFPLTIQPNAPFSRLEIVKHLEKNQIQTRPIFTGNVLRQPAFKNIVHKNLESKFPNADYIMKNSFLIGCNHGLTSAHIEKIKQIFKKFLEKF
jgi:CDP-6-deoxy-D-xylo-4-hexulose-3-dehydrase